MRLGATIIPLLLLVFVWQSPQDIIRQHYESAEAQRLAGNLTAAESEYNAILAEGYERIGEVFLASDDYKRALTALEPAARYRPNSPSVQIDLAIAYFGVGQYDKALEPSRKALISEPDNAGAHQMLGKTYFMLGDLAKSIGELETAARLAPKDVDVTYTLGIAYLRNRQTADAKQLYNSMIKQFGDQPQLHIIIGRAYRQSGLLPEATEEFKRAIALDPHFPRAHYYLGISYLLDEGQKKIGEAAEEFKIEMAANPDEFFANYYLGVVYVYQRKWDLAINSLLKASTIEPNNPDPYFQLGQAYQELNRHEQAVEVLKKAIAFNPDLAHNKNQVTTAHHRLAQSLLKLGQTEAGQKELQIASDLKAQAFKLEQQVQTGAPGMGADKLADLETSAPEIGFGQRVISGAKSDAKTTRELKSTADYYQKILATAHNNVGLLRAERQDFRAAAEQFAMAVKWNPEQEGLDYNLGLAYYKSQLYDRAIPPLENELKTHPENRPARLLLGMSRYDLGKALLQRGDTKGAIDNLERAAKLDPEKPDFHLQLGQAYISAGRKAEGNYEVEVSRQLQRKTPK
jgi:tetratricopeptide (TPR) repeat protein